MSQESLLLILWFSASTLWFYFYLKDVFSGTTKPHMFTWLIWAIMWFIGFGIQITNEWWVGSYILLYFSIIPTIVFLYALKNGDKNIAKIDYIFLLLAWIALILWLAMDLAKLSVIILLSIDLLAYLPTIRKSFYEPYWETARMYALVNVWYIISILTFDTINFENTFYPAGLITINILFITYLLIRRKQLSQ